MALINISDPYYGHLYATIPSSNTGAVFGRYFNAAHGAYEKRLEDDVELNWNNCNYGFSEIKAENGEYVIKLDVSQFKPEEVDVKTVHQFIIIEGHHEERADEDEEEDLIGDLEEDEGADYDRKGQVTRSFTRRYIIPPYCKADEFVANISSDRWLTLKAPIHQAPGAEGKGKTTIPINVV